jgi:CRP/FNR family cyclic AMP-dependent transcriptional regulator
VSTATGPLKVKKREKPAFEAPLFLNSAGVARKVAEFDVKATIFAQGEPAKTLLYIQNGSVKLSVVNEAGKEVVVAVLGPGDFLGEGCLSGQPIRLSTAIAIAPSTLLVVEKEEMIRVLHEEHELSDRFISYLLSRNI